MEHLTSISRAIIYIENNLKQTILLKDMVQQTGYSYFHFHRVFQEIMGETVNQYITNRRLAMSAFELTHSTKNIIDIAVDFEFQSAENFSRAFKKRYKMSPSYYRKNGLDLTIARKTANTDYQIAHNSFLRKEPELLTIPSIKLIGETIQQKTAQISDYWGEINNILPKQKKSRFHYTVFLTDKTCKRESFVIDEELSLFIGIKEDNYSIERFKDHITINSSMYAKFTHQNDYDSIDHSYSYIWETWFPKSNLELGEGIDFEIFDTLSGNTFIYFPIKFKTD